MKRILFVALALNCSVSFASEAPASEASIREMLEVTNTRSLVDNMFTQIEGFMNAALDEATAGRELSPDEQKALAAMKSRMIMMIKEELSWETLEPLYLEIYAKSFTQEEMDGMVAFYKSPAGIAVIRKLPVVLQETMSAMQKRMGPMMARMQQGIEEAIAELQQADSTDESNG